MTKHTHMYVKTLRIRGEAEGEWGFLYRSTLGSLMSGLSEVMEVRYASCGTGECGALCTMSGHGTSIIVEEKRWRNTYAGSIKTTNDKSLAVFFFLFCSFGEGTSRWWYRVYDSHVPKELLISVAVQKERT